MDRCVWGDSPRASTGGSLRKRSRPSSDSMELRDRTAMILGGSGLVGHAVARRLLAAAPRRIVLVALFEERSEEHTSELQSQSNLVCRLLLEKKKITQHPSPG